MDHLGLAFHSQTPVFVRVKVRRNCHCCCCTDSHLTAVEKKKPQKGQITFLANVWTRVKVGQRGNFSIISTESTLFSVKGRGAAGPAPDVTLPARTAPEGQLIPLSAASLISHLLMAGRNRLHSGLRRPPGASRGYPSQTLGVNAKTPER